MSKPVSDFDAFSNRVTSNEEWFAYCGKLYFEEIKRNGQFARDVREKSGRSLRSVAKAMGISAMYLSDMERGNRNWSSQQVEKWKKAMQP
jgi:predicted transcriptional regulator